MEKIIKKLKNNSFFGSVFYVGSGKLIAQIITVVSTLLLVRIYENSDYGEYGIITSTAQLIMSLATLGLTSAIMVPEKDEESQNVYMTACFITLVISISFCCILFSISPFYHIVNVSGNYYVAITIMSLSILLTNFTSITTVYVNRKKLNKLLFVNPIIGATANFLIAIPLGLFGVGYIGFAVASLLSNLIISFQMMIRSHPFKKNFHLKTIFYVIKKYKNYILFQCPSNLIGNFSVQYPTQFLSRIFDNAILGSYTMCLQVLQYPAQLIAAPISTIYFRTASEYQLQGKNFSDFTFKLITKLMLIAFPMILVVIFFGESLFSLALGENWAEAGRISSLLIVQYVLLFCSQCTSYCRVALGRQRLNLIYSISNLIITVLFCSIGYMIYGSLYGTLLLFSIGRSIVLIFDMFLNFICMKKNQFKYLLFAFAYYLICLGIILLNNRYIK